MDIKLFRRLQETGVLFDIGADCILVAVQEYERIIEDFKQKAPDYMEIIPLARKFEGIK